MESNQDEGIAQQAFQLHQKLNEKHASFIHSRNIEAIKCLYTFQKKLSQKQLIPLRGFSKDVSFMCPMYNLIRIQKSRRNMFLKNLVTLFDVPKDPFSDSEDPIMQDLSFFRFLGDCLAYLDYKSIEEVLHVTFYINLILSIGAEELKAVLDGYGEDEVPSRPILFRANIYTIIIQLRNFLQKRYALTFA